MNYLKYFTILFILTMNTFAQEQVLQTENISNWYIGPAIKITPIKEQFSSMLGLRVGWILNNKLSIGGGFYSVFTKVDAAKGAMPVEIPLDIDFQYLGFEAEYVINDLGWGYMSLYSLMGGGAARYVKDEGSTFKSTQQEGETIFSIVVEPGVTTEFFVNNWLHINTALTYRIVVGIEKQNLKDGDFSGVDLNFCFKFSGF